jgi:Tfp pilus assembly ATPase PilU
MADGHKELGTQTYDQHLDELIEGGQITEDTKRAALATANQPMIGSKRPKQA